MGMGQEDERGVDGGRDSAARVILRRGRARPLWYGHPWVYAQAIERLDGEAQPGDVVSVVDHDGRFIGRGLYNPRTLIPVRMVTRMEEPADAAFFGRRLERARALRSRLGLPSPRTTAWRLANSEGDGLPGLVIDVFGEAVVVQITTLGMWQRRDTILDALGALLNPRAVFVLAAPAFAEKEGFRHEPHLARGTPLDPVACLEDDLRLQVEPLTGQKTGMFLDQRPSRMRVGQLARGARVLDAYAYAGGFALQAARGGAASVTAVDTSPRAVERIGLHAALNNLEVEIVQADAFRFLEECAPEAFDLIVLDPPPFARARKDLEQALKAYERLNTLALGAAAEGAILVTCSCSQNVGEEEFERMLAGAARRTGRSVRVFERHGPGEDHPVPAGFSEGRYLKVLFAVLD
jgi:23S rRNA (cytosine1962-C5)-methyltransferase